VKLLASRLSRTPSQGRAYKRVQVKCNFFLTIESKSFFSTMLGHSLVAVLALPLLSLAGPMPQVAGGGGSGNGVSNSQCDTGSLQCCSSVTTPQAYSQSAGATGIVAQLLGTVEGTIGISCDSIPVIGITGNSCSAQPACCTGDVFNSVITLGCSPVNLNV